MSDQLLKSTTVVSFVTFLSRIIGFVRDMILASLFGASAGNDAFLLAFRIPNFLRRLFAEGAFSQAFVPVLSEYRAHHQGEVKRLINNVFGVLSVALLLITILGILATPLVVRVFAPGYDANDPRFILASHMLPITFPYIFFISLTAFAGGIQNAHRRFAAPAFTPVLLNLCLIFAAVCLSSLFVEPILALAWGVLLAGIVQLLFQIPFLAKLSLLPVPRLDFQDKGVKKILSLMCPALIGASVMQINLLVDSIFASFLPVGSITWLYYSDRMLEFPIGVFGVALATVVLPHLSQDHAQKNHQRFSASIDWALRWILLIGIPATLGLVLLAGPVLATLFQHGHFSDHDAIMAARSLVALSLGLVCFLAVKILVSAFYARQNTKFPVKVAIFAMVANVVLSGIFIVPLAHAGLALASALASILNVGILLWVLLKEKIYVPVCGWQSFGLRLLLANGAMASLLWWFSPEMEQWLQWSALNRVMMLGALIGGSVVAYFGGLLVSGLRYRHLRLQMVPEIDLT